MGKDGKKILMVTSEAVPFAKSGGLADMVSALAVQLRREGNDVRMVMPRYYDIDRSGLTLRKEPLGIPLGFEEEWVGVYEAVLPHSDVPVYFLDHEGLYGRKGIYGPTNSEAFPDNARRYTLLSRGAFQLCRYLQWIPDVMHAHDWPTALVPVYLYTWEKDTEFAGTASVITIHNIGYQGWFPKEDIHHTQLSWEEFHITGLEYHDSLNLLKAGIQNADIVTTVSPTYAREIQTPEYGEGLDPLLRHRSGDLFGIINGMDYDDWNPETDPFIKPDNFTSRKIAPKKKVKAALQKEAGLEVDPEKPLIGIVSRLVEQKGFGDLCGPSYGCLFSICWDMDVQFVILGTGETWCENELKALDANLPNLKAYIEFSNAMAHKIEAASDFFLMPSKYEPCGLNQLYSLRYGSLPIVRRTGGLADTVENYNQETGEGTGFVFDDLNPGSIYNVVGWAVWAWNHKPEHIKAMRKRAMEKRFSWEKSAGDYEEMYQWARDRREGRFPRSW